MCFFLFAFHIVINKRLDIDGRIEILGRVFAQFPLDDVFLVPAIREAIDQYKDTASESLLDDLETSADSGESP